MNALGCLDRDTLAGWVSEIVEPGAIVHTDGWSGYGGLTRSGFDHRPGLQHRPRPDRQFVLPRADRAISKLKTWLQGTHRSASTKHLRSIWMSSSSATTGGAPRWPPSRRCSGSERCTSPRPTARSPVAPQPEPTGYSRAALCMEAAVLERCCMGEEGALNVWRWIRDRRYCNSRINPPLIANDS